MCLIETSLGLHGIVVRSPHRIMWTFPKEENEQEMLPAEGVGALQGIPATQPLPLVHFGDRWVDNDESADLLGTWIAMKDEGYRDCTCGHDISASSDPWDRTTMKTCWIVPEAT